MAELKYESPQSVGDAVALLAAEGATARVFAGGTDLLVQMQEEIIEPTMLVDIKKIAETRQIKIDQDHIIIGAAVTGSELGEHEQLKRIWPGVVEAVELIGSYQVQGRATIGGNLCNASPAADSVPALIAAGGSIRISGPEGTRELAVEEFLVAPGKTVLKQGEFVTAIVLPRRPSRSSDAYLRFIPRTEMDIAVVGAAVSVTLNSDGRCEAARVALGAVAPTALLVDSMSEILIGNILDNSVLQALARSAGDACSPINDKRGTVEFRVKVAGVLTCRAAKIAWERAEKN